MQNLCTSRLQRVRLEIAQTVSSVALPQRKTGAPLDAGGGSLKPKTLLCSTLKGTAPSSWVRGLESLKRRREQPN